MGTNENKPDMETIADIVREMREAAKSTDLFNGEEVGEPLIRGTKVEEWADRIETAAERERNAHTNDIHNALYMATGIPGNAAAMRVALLNVRRIASINICECEGDYSDKKAIEIVDAALSAPARNCDVGTAEEQQARHYAWCRKHGIDGDNKVNCAHPDMSCVLCALRWAQMPYEGKEKSNG